MIAVLFLLLIASLISYKKTVLFSAVVFMFMNNLSSGIEGVKLYYAIVLAQIVLFYLLGYYKKKKECEFRKRSRRETNCGKREKPLR